jgi:hypothetical protein
MGVGIHQPNFLGWIGWWHKFYSASTFIIYAGVQYEKGGYQNRVRFPNGTWATVPVMRKGMISIKDIQISNQVSLNKLEKRIIQEFGGELFFERLDGIRYVFRSDWKYLLDLNMALIDKVQEAITSASSIRSPHVVVDLDCHLNETPGEALASLVKSYEMPGTYLSGGDVVKYLKRKELPLEEVLIQKIHKPEDCTILKLLTTELDPGEVIQNSGEWLKWEAEIK